MIIFPNAKINIGLNIVEKRDDGFHNIETLMYPVLITDRLEIKKTPGHSNGNITFTSSGINIDGNTQDNLICKAYNLLHSDFNLPSVTMHLHKQIPIGAGLGGGSADAAFALKGINNMFGLMLSYDELERYAAQLGSDCAFFIKNKPSFATQRGEKLQIIPINLANYFIAIVIPNTSVSTKEAYANICPQKPENSLKKLLTQAVNKWQENIKNDFEETVFKQKSEIATIKENMIKAGAIYSSMSGSGAAVFGLFSSKPNLKFMIKKNYFYWQTKL